MVEKLRKIEFDGCRLNDRQIRFVIRKLPDTAAYLCSEYALDRDFWDVLTWCIENGVR